MLTQPLDDDIKDDPRFENKTSFIMDAYVKAIESAGGRVVPLIYDADLNETLKKMEQLNGVFYCGGSADHD